jgi:signal transduction histidine kinase
VSLKLRLLITMVAMVVAAVLALSALELSTLSTTWLAHVNERSDTTAKFVMRWLMYRVGELPPPAPGASIEEVRLQWRDAIASDEDVPLVLASLLAQTPPIVEISVADENSHILASTTRAKVGALMPQRLTLSTLIDMGPVDRLLAMLGSNIDYENRRDLGVLGQSLPVFRIQVLVSSRLLREAILPAMGRTALVSLAALLIATALAYGTARLSLRPVERISGIIDLIASGRLVPAGNPAYGAPAREFQAVEQKLRLLGEQFRGAQEGASQLRSTMERRLAAINRLTGGVAHEIKNPLNSIALRLELLKSRVLPEVPDAEEELSIIAQEITRLDRVVRTFLDFTRPVDLQSTDLDLGALVQEVLTLMAPEAASRKVDIAWSPPQPPAAISGDADLLKQAVLNVCRNALESMPNGGKMTVEVARESSEWVLSVADTGPGIPEEEREKIFQLYYSTKPQGSGIGLAMTFRALQLHGGSIEVGGNPGGGTQFRMRLPVRT